VRYYLSTDTAYGAADIAQTSASNGTGTCQRTLTTLNFCALSNVSKLACYMPTGVVTGTNCYVLVVDDVLNTVIVYAESNFGRATNGTIK
jgi:hypothetical protein